MEKRRSDRRPGTSGLKSQGNSSRDAGEKKKGMTRLNRFIANSGICSRREADELIVRGLVLVNGKKVVDLGTRVSIDDDVRYKGRKLSSEKKVYILLNKPKGYVTTVEDPHAEHTVLDIIGNACPERIYPVGRLDKDTTGVLLLTNDGDLTGKLTHPKYNRKKVYHVFLDKPVERSDLFRLTDGIILDREKVVADAVSYTDPDDKSQLGIELHSGQNRVIKRMFESLGYRVRKLDRVYFAGLTKKNLPRGKWRFLSMKEISMLKRGIS
jgi:23S rRNA pseudouridine2605 synthase